MIMFARRAAAIDDGQPRFRRTPEQERRLADNIKELQRINALRVAVKAGKQAAEKATRLQAYKREQEARLKQQSRERATDRWQTAARLGKAQRQQKKLQHLPGQKWSVNRSGEYEKKGQGHSTSFPLWRRGL